MEIIMLCIAVSLILSLAILAFFYAKSSRWKVFFIGAAFATLFSVGTFFLSYFCGTKHAYYKEVFHYKVVSIRHENKWTTQESRTYQEKVGEDEDGNDITETKTEYYTDTHGPFWYMRIEDGRESSVPESTYEEWKSVWNNERQTGMHNGSSASGDRSIDGPIFDCDWPGSFETIFPYEEIRNYLNKVRASSYTVMKYKTDDKALKDKYKRPVDEGNINPFVSYCYFSLNGNETMKLRRLCSEIGPKYEIHPLFIFLDSSQSSIATVNDIVGAWEGPNKNELAVFVGVNDKSIAEWVKVESWMDNTTLHGMMESYLIGKKIDGEILFKSLKELVPENWVRKRFRDFDYISLEISPVAYFVGFFVQILATGLAFVIAEVIDQKTTSRSSGYGFGYRNYKL